jgi:hypothetical protein
MGNDNTLAGYPIDVAALAAGAFMLGMNHFEGQPFQEGLAQVFCIAVHCAILDELDGVAPNLEGIPADVAGRLGPSTPQGIKDVFCEVESKLFVETYNTIRLRAASEGVDLEKFAAALPEATKICKALASRS